MRNEIRLSLLYKIRLRTVGYLALIVVFMLLAISDASAKGDNAKLEARLKALEQQVAENEIKIATLTAVAKQIAPWPKFAKTIEDWLIVVGDGPDSTFGCMTICANENIERLGNCHPWDKECIQHTTDELSDCQLQCPQ